MSKWVNFAEVRQKVSLEQVLTRYYKITSLNRQGEKLIGPCPVHGGDSPRAFHADLDRNIWHCFSQCKGGGNQLDLVAKKEGISVREAALRLQEFFLGDHRETPEDDEGRKSSGKTGVRPKSRPSARRGDVPEGRPPPPETVEPPSRNPALDLKLDLKSDHPHLADRQLKPETISHFGVGYCSKGILRGMIAIPIHDEDGVLVAYAGRRLKTSDIDQYGKYKLPKGFRKELVLFNFHHNREMMAENGLILVEGFFSVMKLHEAGFPNVVASMGCEVSDYQLELLARAKDVIVLFDGNEAGREGAKHVVERLGEGSTVRLVHLPDDTEPDDLSPQALRWLVNGMQVLDLTRVSFSINSTS